MKYNDFLEAQSAWAYVQKVVHEFRKGKDVQIVAETIYHQCYWLMQKIDGQTKYAMTWCSWDSNINNDDAEFSTLDEVERWLFEKYTDGIVTEVYCESM